MLLTLYHVLLYLLFGVGAFGLLTSTITTGIIITSAVRFLVRRNRSATPFTPPVTVLKPLHGDEPGLEAHLETFFTQDYPHFTLAFCASRAEDAGLAAARRVAARYPEVPALFFVSGPSPVPNAKVWSMMAMEHCTADEIVVMSDSDVSVGPDYLRAIIAPFADPQVGVLTCLYRGIPVVAGPDRERGTGDFWTSVEAAGLSVEMSGGVLAAELLEGVHFALGPTMVARRNSLDKIGGISALADYHADDFVLGNFITAAGDRGVLSSYIVEHHVQAGTFASAAAHQIRWMKSTRFSRPKGHLGTVLTFSVVFALVSAAASVVLGHPMVAAWCLGIGVGTRVLLAAIIGGVVVKDPNPMRTMLLYPVRDLLGFFFWCISYSGTNIVLWRGRRYRILENGKMVPVEAA